MLLKQEVSSHMMIVVPVLWKNAVSVNYRIVKREIHVESHLYVQGKIN